MKVAFVVQRYGLEISGGAELHCRWIAEHMSRHWRTQVLTTRALDYLTWEDFYLESDEIINQVPVKRFSVQRPRNPEKFGRIQNHILANEHRFEDELKWLDEEGPYSPELIQYIQDHSHDYDYFIFFSYRYYHSYHGIRALPEKSILVPTAERDEIIHMYLFKDLFQLPRALVYNSVEERLMINRLSQNVGIPGETIGVGSEIPEKYSEENFRNSFDIDGDYIIYLGRIDQNKGCSELFEFYLQYKRETKSSIKLILIGSTILKIPPHPDIRYLGFLTEYEKFSALSGARFLVMPSFYESLSMVTLEAWAMGVPVLANSRCEVLKGQCIRSRGGLFYKDYSDFMSAADLLLKDSRLSRALGENGRDYFMQNYTWERIENKYLELFGRMDKARVKR